MNVTAEVQAKIIELANAGKKSGLIAVMTKTKKDVVLEVLKAAGIEVDGAPVEETKTPDATVVGADAAATDAPAADAAPVAEGDAPAAGGDETQNKLAQMLNKAQEEKAAAPAKAAKEKKERTPRTTKKDKSMSDSQRKVIAIISDSLKLVYLTTRPSYGSLATAELMAERAKRRLGHNKPKLAPLAGAEDLRVEILAIAESTTQAEDIKAEQHVIFEANYTMLSTSPKGKTKVEAPKAPEAPAADAAPADAVAETEEPVVETEAADEVQTEEQPA